MILPLEIPMGEREMNNIFYMPGTMRCVITSINL